MKPTLVTGATGLVGFNIVLSLRRRGTPIRCLVRSPDTARELLGAEVEIVPGDLSDEASIRAATQGCPTVFHAAGLPEQWLADPGRFDRVNVDGTRRMVEAALEHGVQRFVFTSTVDVFAAARGEEHDESVLDPHPKGTHYERSKQQADRLVVEAMERGLPAVFLHPSAVYGPGPLTSRGLNHFFADLRDGRIPLLLPGGLPLVFAPDVGEGHVLAAERGTIGSRFILSDDYLTLEEMARRVVAAFGRRRVPPVLPLWVGRLVSEAGELVSRVTRRPPLIPRGQLHLLQWGALPRAHRARQELGWTPTPFAEGLPRALDHLSKS